NRDSRKRDLQLEARAHVAVQKWIDEGALRGRATTCEAIREIHRRFCEQLPKELLWVQGSGTAGRVEVIASELRDRDVQVGELVPVSPGAIPRFLNRYEQAYERLARTGKIIAAAAAHYPLVWIHPFRDVNGRVAGLMSHATLLDLLNAGALWSLSRGLARNVSDYKSHLAACDQPRRNDLDGRGHLSQENLVAFTRFFLATCVDQVRFMEELMQPDTLRTRIQLWAEEEIRMGRLPERTQTILEAVLYRGELPRADIAVIVGRGERQARRVVSALVECGVLTSASSRAPLQLAFPAALVSRWLPGLFPGKAERPGR